jgi:hypothetical protein
MNSLKPLAVLFASVAFAAQGYAADAPIKRLHDTDHDVIHLNDGHDVQLPHCTDAKGNRVRFSMIAKGAADGTYGPSGTGWSIFSTFLPNRGAEVRMTQDFLDLPYQTAQFAAELECSHHEHGDIYQTFMNTVQGLPTKGSSREMVLRADCDGVKSVRDKYGFTPDDIRKAFAPFPAAPPDHPPTSERLEKALVCYSEPPAAMAKPLSPG